VAPDAGIAHLASVRPLIDAPLAAHAAATSGARVNCRRPAIRNIPARFPIFRNAPPRSLLHCIRGGHYPLVILGGGSLSPGSISALRVTGGPVIGGRTRVCTPARQADTPERRPGSSRLLGCTATEEWSPPCVLIWSTVSRGFVPWRVSCAGPRSAWLPL
jgi:hypothetical protein